MTFRFFALLFLLASAAATHAQGVAAAEAEASKCLDRIATVRREVLGRYEDGLTELQSQFQKVADLESALAVRAERQRVQKDQSLTEKQFANEPRSLRTLQQQTLAKLEELIPAVVNESVPKLVELKKSLTMAGKLDEAVTVRGLIAKLQDDHIRVQRADNGELVAAETLIQAYAADRSRADRTYKGTRVVVRGVIGAYRPDADGQRYVVYLTKGQNAGWIGCIFDQTTVKLREEKQFNTSYLVATNKGDIVARLQAGQTVDIQGTCDGFEDVVRLSKCEFVR